MATADLIQELNTDLLDAYAAIEEKGGTVPEQKNTSNLAEAITSIEGGGITPRPPLPEYPYPVEEFDGGEYGAIAYLRDDEVHYYTATSESDITIATGSASNTYTLKTLDDGFVITSANVLAYAVGSTRTSLPNYTLRYCTLLQNFYWSKDSHLTSIGTYFVSQCPNFNYPIDIPEGVKTIGKNFMSGDAAFNQPLTLPQTVDTIEANFLSGCTAFNQPLNVEKIAKIGDSFLNNCAAYDQPFNFLEIKSIENYFLESCKSYNQHIWFPDTLTSIGWSFMSRCTSFNKPIVLPDTLRTISDGNSSDQGFLYGCTSFNQPIQIPATLNKVPYSFLRECTAFNSPVEFRGSTITISQYFMYSCTSFNQPLELPDTITSIGDAFLQLCKSFNQPLALPNAVTNIGTEFMYGCNSFVGPLNVGKAAGGTGGVRYLATSDASAPMYAEGVTLTGENAEAWIMMLPNRDTSPYRKLINGNA